MMRTQRMKVYAIGWLFVAGLAASLMLPVSSFTVTTSLASSGRRKDAVLLQRRHMLPPDHHQMVDPVALDHLLQQSSQLLADATAAAGKTDQGWWQSYLEIFKGALSFVHSTVDGPLRSIGITQTWGPSIAIFTASIRALLVPISIQQNKSTEYMRALKPYVADIKKKFEDKDTQNKAIGKLYEDAEQNPLAGCVTALVQLPVLLGLYRGIRLLAIDGQLNEPFLWIPNLQGPVHGPDYRDMDWLAQGWTTPMEGGLPVPPLGWETTLAFLVMPVILVCLQSFTMNTLQPPQDEMSEEEKEQMENTGLALKFLPLLIGFFSLQVPAGLTIYWFTTNIFTLTQSLAVKAYFKANPPKIELPEYWKALTENKDFENMTPEERREATQAGIRVGPSFDDLIDEARFHSLIERRSIREESAAWQRAQAGSVEIPSELKEWAQKSQSPESVTA